MICQVCGYHSGPLTLKHKTCPRVHLMKPRPVVRDEEVPVSGYENVPDDPDAPPLNLCRYCTGGTDRDGDVCVQCWGSGRGD